MITSSFNQHVGPTVLIKTTKKYAEHWWKALQQLSKIEKMHHLERKRHYLPLDLKGSSDFNVIASVNNKHFASPTTVQSF